MSELQRFLPADQEILVSLFYRIGDWMSHIDDTDTNGTSEELERQQMMNALQKLSDNKKAGALCNELAAEALRQKDSWGRWSDMSAEPLSDVAKAKSVLLGQATADEYRLYAKSLVTIATAVARAYRESEDVEVEREGFMGWLSQKTNTLPMALTDREAYKELNISPAEDSALTELMATLKDG